MRRHLIKASLLVTTLTISAAPAAHAQSATPDVLNEQLFFGDVFGNMEVYPAGNVDGDLSAIASGFGNVVTMDAIDATTIESEQDFSGNADARSTIDASDISGNVTAQATAYGNSGVISGDHAEIDLTEADQDASGDRVSAATDLRLRNTTTVSAASIATANIMASHTENGRIDGTVDQHSDVATVSADTDVEACCTAQQTTATASAIVNAYDATSSQGRVVAIVDQDSDGNLVSADADLVQVDGTDTVTASNAAANSINISNEYGFVQLQGEQHNDATVRADASAQLDDWSGTSSVSSYGVGNSALTYNVGSDIDTYNFVQSNDGDVSSSASFNGTNGGSGVVSLTSTSIGNAYTSTVCALCGTNSATGSISQRNTGDIAASGVIVTNGTRGTFGSSAAIGNSATFSSYRNSGSD